MNNQIFHCHKIEDKDVLIFHSLGKITSEDVKEVMQTFSSGKICTPKIGILSVEERFFPDLKDTPLVVHEGEYVFYAVEKLRFGLFEKTHKRIFIWPPMTGDLYALPVDAVSFERPKDDVKQTWLISESGEEKPLCKHTYDNKEHICFFEKKQLLREFFITGKEMFCTADILKHYFRWSRPDPWVKEHFTITDVEEPMFYLRHDLKEIPGWSVRLCYPSRPPLYGWEIDE